MIRTGIMGGTFNPVHNGHLIIASYAMEQYNLDEIWFITSGNPPHKRDKEMPDAMTRHKMLCLAVEDNSAFTPVDCEVRRADYSYTVNTLRNLRTSCPDRRFYFIAGQDSLHDIPKWYKPKEILSLAAMLVFPRGEGAALEAEIERVKGLFGGDIRPVDAPVFGVSSTQIRKRVFEGKSIRYIVPDKVREFIEENNLYKEKPDGNS